MFQKVASVSLSLCLLALASVASRPILAEDAVDFETQVWPILEAKCITCHGPEDQFNKLRLDSKESILKGGKNGKVVIPGEPDESPMYVRTSLPADDLDIMPAEGDPLTPEQLEILRSWIAGGATFGDWTGAGP